MKWHGTLKQNCSFLHNNINRLKKQVDNTKVIIDNNANTDDEYAEAAIIITVIIITNRDCP